MSEDALAVESIIGLKGSFGFIPKPPFSPGVRVKVRVRGKLNP